MLNHFLAAIVFGGIAFGVGLVVLKKRLCWTKSVPEKPSSIPVVPPEPYPVQNIRLKHSSRWKCANEHCDEMTCINDKQIGELHTKMVLGTCDCANYPMICPKCRSMKHKKCPRCAICGEQSNVITLRELRLSNKDPADYISFIPSEVPRQYYCGFNGYPRHISKIRTTGTIYEVFASASAFD
jgi:hypothetical protein